MARLFNLHRPLLLVVCTLCALIDRPGHGPKRPHGALLIGSLFDVSIAPLLIALMRWEVAVCRCGILSSSDAVFARAVEGKEV